MVDGESSIAQEQIHQYVRRMILYDSRLEKA
jgi:hypothetical protein